MLIMSPWLHWLSGEVVVKRNRVVDVVTMVTMVTICLTWLPKWLMFEINCFARLRGGMNIFEL